MEMHMKFQSIPRSDTALIHSFAGVVPRIPEPCRRSAVNILTACPSVDFFDKLIPTPRTPAKNLAHAVVARGLHYVYSSARLGWGG
jgi:hypothetical protein